MLIEVVWHELSVVGRTIYETCVMMRHTFDTSTRSITVQQQLIQPYYAAQNFCHTVPRS